MMASIPTCKCLEPIFSSRITRRKRSNLIKNDSRRRERRNERRRRTLVLQVRVRPHQRRLKESCLVIVTRVTTRIFLIIKKMDIIQCMLGNIYL
jgi:hypothetical protein